MLLATLNSALGHICSLFFKKEMELSLIGLQNAGKTSLVNVLTTGAFHEDMIPTVGFNMRKVTKGAVTIKLWDLGGQVMFHRSRHTMSHDSLHIHLQVKSLQVDFLWRFCCFQNQRRILTCMRCAAPIQKHVGEVLQGRASHCICCRCSRS